MFSRADLLDYMLPKQIAI